MGNGWRAIDWKTLIKDVSAAKDMICMNISKIVCGLSIVLLQMIIRLLTSALEIRNKKFENRCFDLLLWRKLQ